MEGGISECRRHLFNAEFAKVAKATAVGGALAAPRTDQWLGFPENHANTREFPH
jgi:hypothetical protein